MHDSLKKIKATLESTLDSSKLLSEKDPIRSIQAKEPVIPPFLTELRSRIH
jgi:hypothetical protein